VSAVAEDLQPSIRRHDEAYDRKVAELNRHARGGEKRAAHVELVDASAVKVEPIRWLWPGWLARGKFHLLAGAPGTGKTTIAMHLAACVSTGRALPSGFCPRPGNVLIWSGEDGIADTLTPRLIAAGADLARVHFVGDVCENGERYPFDPARDVQKLGERIDGIDDVALLIVDPLVSAVKGEGNANPEVRRGLSPLIELAAKIDAALLGITHYSKGTQGRDPRERVNGSIAYVAAARIAFGTAVQELGEGEAPQTIMARIKSNLGPDGGGFRYALEQIELEEYIGVTASRIVWGNRVDGTARELLSEPDQRSAASRDDAADFLRNLLADGSRATNDVLREAKSAGYSRDQMKRAKDRIGVESVKVGMDGGWVWRMPPRNLNNCAPFRSAAPFAPFDEDALPSSDNASEGSP
jgi:hypothetical protein